MPVWQVHWMKRWLPWTQPMLRTKNMFVLYSEKGRTSMFCLRFVWELYASKKKTNGILGMLSKFWTRNKCFLCQNIDMKNCNYLTWPWPDFGQKSGWMASYGQMTVTIDICVQNGPENMCRTARLWHLFYNGIVWPNLVLILFKHDLRIHPVPLEDIY